jgi:type II secretory pathway pseudopilin PulG
MTATTTSTRGDKGRWWRAEGATAGPQPLRRAGRGRTRIPVRGRAFTLTELLIVIGIIVLIVGLAVPAFRAMTGGRSVDAAQNQLAAVLGQARAEAIGLQKMRGVLFYLDPATDRVNAVLVEDGGRPEHPPATPEQVPDVFLDAVADRDPVPLPAGVGLNAIDNAAVQPGSTTQRGRREDDGYIGYNVLPDDAQPLPARPVRIGGVILFDGYGRLVTKRYGFLTGREPLTGSAAQPLKPTRVGELFGYLPDGGQPPEWIVQRQSVSGRLQSADNKRPPRSQIGFALFDAEPSRNLEHTPGDPQFSDPNAGQYASGSREFQEEDWLDQNAYPVLVNRYNGTLVRGE